jgi:hypothetical protein
MLTGHKKNDALKFRRRFCLQASGLNVKRWLARCHGLAAACGA